MQQLLAKASLQHRSMRANLGRYNPLLGQCHGSNSTMRPRGDQVPSCENTIRGPNFRFADESSTTGAPERVYHGCSSERCESLRTLPRKSTRYRRVKAPGGNPSLCPVNPTSNSCVLSHRFALRYECPASKN